MYTCLLLNWLKKRKIKNCIKMHIYMARCSALALIAFLVSPPSLVMATSYDLNWEAGVDYTAWVAQNTFYAGDVLSE